MATSDYWEMGLHKKNQRMVIDHFLLQYWTLCLVIRYRVSYSKVWWSILLWWGYRIDFFSNIRGATTKQNYLSHFAMGYPVVSMYVHMYFWLVFNVIFLLGLCRNSIHTLQVFKPTSNNLYWFLITSWWKWGKWSTLTNQKKNLWLCLINLILIMNLF